MRTVMALLLSLLMGGVIGYALGHHTGIHAPDPDGRFPVVCTRTRHECWQGGRRVDAPTPGPCVKDSNVQWEPLSDLLGQPAPGTPTSPGSETALAFSYACIAAE
jgi:hypothetical protein